MHRSEQVFSKRTNLLTFTMPRPSSHVRLFPAPKDRARKLKASGRHCFTGEPHECSDVYLTPVEAAVNALLRGPLKNFSQHGSNPSAVPT